MSARGIHARSSHLTLSLSLKNTTIKGEGEGGEEAKQIEGALAIWSREVMAY